MIGRKYEPPYRANTISKYTGIYGVVYFCTKADVEKIHPFGVVTLWRNGSSVSVSIKSNNGKRMIFGKRKLMIRDLVKFIELNEDLLWEYWNTDPKIADSKVTMEKFRKI